ncbi:MAG: UDP-glucose/GDP-mannose dehydrogenase family protein [Silvibacterium sp.]
MNISVIGAGYVGLVSAACFAELGHTVIGVDNDPAKLLALEEGRVPIHESLLPELLQRHLGQRLTFTDSIARAVRASDVVFITVGTPSSVTGDADLCYVEAVIREVARHITSKKLIVEKSTVPVRTCDSIRRTMELNGAPPHLFSVASNPEFLREGTAVTDFLYPDRIVAGVDDAFSEDKLRQIYAPLWGGSYYRRDDLVPGDDSALPRFIVTNTKSAELIKHTSNAFLAMKISFMNAIANIAERVGGDIDQIKEGVGSDSRIGASFLNAGIGYGGSCFPKDVLAFRAVARDAGYDFDLLDSVMRINQDQRNQFLRKVREALWTLRNKRIAVLGLAFKAGTDDVRESPAIEIVKALIKEGCHITAFDPVAMPRALEEIQARAGEGSIEMASDAYAAAEDADAVLILTEWSEFASLDLRKLRRKMRLPVIIDGRNLYRPEEMDAAGFVYYSIGRTPVFPVERVNPTLELVFEEIA